MSPPPTTPEPAQHEKILVRMRRPQRVQVHAPALPAVEAAAQPAAVGTAKIPFQPAAPVNAQPAPVNVLLAPINPLPAPNNAPQAPLDALPAVFDALPPPLDALPPLEAKASPPLENSQQGSGDWLQYINFDT